MADQYAPNFATGGTNTWLPVWKLSRCMKKAGWTYKASGDGTSKDTTGTPANDLWGGNADPMADTAPAWTGNAWILFEGCSTLRIPITSAPTGTFLRGENIKQATTNAEGEFLGYVIDLAGTTGYMVVMPRVAGSGSGRWGWDTTYDITGDSSGATVAQKGTAIEYVRQIVLFKAGAGSVQLGTVYYQCVDVVGESASLFSSYLGATGCTALIPPCGGGTGNGFPNIAYVVFGTGGNVSHSTWSRSSNTTSFGKAQIVATNVIPSSGVSADGTLWIAYAIPYINAGAYGGFGLMRLDDQEEGDVDPYVWLSPNQITWGSTNRTTLTSDMGTYDQMNFSNTYWHAYPMVRGWRKRGLTGEGYCDYEIHVKGRFGSTSKVALNTGDREVTACDLQTRYVGQPLFVESVVSTVKQTKGTPRWMRMMQGGASYDTYASKKWIQLSNQNAAVVLGPYDGSTTPSFS